MHIKSAITFALAVVAIAGLAGCAQRRSDRAKADCIRNMEIIWGAAGSYCLENKKSPDFVCSPQMVTNYIKDGRVPKCALGTADYQAFVVETGPRCPNRPDLHFGHKYPK